MELFIRDVKNVFLEVITSVDPSELDLYFHAVIDKHGKRWFTVHANSGLWWEKAQKKVGPNVAVGAPLFFIDDVHLKQHIGLQAAYCKSKHLLFILTCQLTSVCIGSGLFELGRPKVSTTWLEAACPLPRD